MKKNLFSLCILTLCIFCFRNSTANALGLELDRVFHSQDPALEWTHGAAYANDGTLWIADWRPSLNHGIVFQYDPNQPDGGYTSPLSSFNLPSTHVRDMAWDHDTNTPWVAFGNGDIINYDQSGNFIRMFNVGADTSGLAYHDNSLFISYKGSAGGVEKYSTDGTSLGSFPFDGDVSYWSGMAYDEDRGLLWVMHDGVGWTAYDPDTGTLIAELDWGIISDLGWNIALSYGDGALWAGSVFDNTIGRLHVTPAIPEPATMLLLGAGLIGLSAFRRKFRK